MWLLRRMMKQICTQIFMWVQIFVAAARDLGITTTAPTRAGMVVEPTITGLSGHGSAVKVVLEADRLLRCRRSGQIGRPKHLRSALQRANLAHQTTNQRPPAVGSLPTGPLRSIYFTAKDRELAKEDELAKGPAETPKPTLAAVAADLASPNSTRKLTWAGQDGRSAR